MATHSEWTTSASCSFEVIWRTIWAVSLVYSYTIITLVVSIMHSSYQDFLRMHIMHRLAGEKLLWCARWNCSQQFILQRRLWNICIVCSIFFYILDSDYCINDYSDNRNSCDHSDNATGSTTGGGDNPSDGGYFRGNLSLKLDMVPKWFHRWRKRLSNVRDAQLSLRKSILWLGSRYATLFCMHLPAVNLRLGWNAFHTHLFADTCSWILDLGLWGANKDTRS